MSVKIFIDSNVLIYAHDADAGVKQKVAGDVLKDLWSSGLGIISTQVMQEFYVNVTRKIPTPLARSSVRTILSNYTRWQVEQVSPTTVLAASRIEERYKLSFWDSLILAAAQQGGAEKILTEDLHAGQKIDGILVENPFSTDAD